MSTINNQTTSAQIIDRMNEVQVELAQVTNKLKSALSYESELESELLQSNPRYAELAKLVDEYLESPAYLEHRKVAGEMNDIVFSSLREETDEGEGVSFFDKRNALIDEFTALKVSVPEVAAASQKYVEDVRAALSEYNKSLASLFSSYSWFNEAPMPLSDGSFDMFLSAEEKGIYYDLDGCDGCEECTIVEQE